MSFASAGTPFIAKAKYFLRPFIAILRRKTRREEGSVVIALAVCLPAFLRKFGKFRIVRPHELAKLLKTASGFLRAVNRRRPVVNHCLAQILLYAVALTEHIAHCKLSLAVFPCG